MRSWLKVFFDDALSLAYGLKCQFLIGHACLLLGHRTDLMNLGLKLIPDGSTAKRMGDLHLGRLPRLSANARRRRNSESELFLKLRVGMVLPVKRLNLEGGLSDISEKCALQKRHGRTSVGGYIAKRRDMTALYLVVGHAPTSLFHCCGRSAARPPVRCVGLFSRNRNDQPQRRGKAGHSNRFR